MEVNLEHSAAPVRDAASVVMLRDGAHGLEVFLVKRHGLSDVLGGAHVFPGGKVDCEDAEDAVALDLDGDAMHASLDERDLDGRGARALYVAAMREAFEETGVLFARDASAEEAARAWSLHREGHSFDEVATLMRLVLQASLLQPWSRWITPSVGGVMRKRFDTRFFLARVPAGQVPRHDEREAIEGDWMRPAEALDRYWDGTMQLAPPQIMELAQLASLRDVAQAFEEARSRPPPIVLPEAFVAEGRQYVCYPGDARHSVPGRAMRGPTRLCFASGRFEPEEGLQALLATGA